MTCVSPIKIKNPQINRETLHGRDLYMWVPCGKCPQCLKRRAAQWVFRLKQVDKHALTACFVTYTYDDDHVPITKNGYQTLDRKAHSLFMKRLRKELSKQNYQSKMLYYVVGEYGGQTERPHYHSILFNLPELYIVNEHKMEKLWGLGRVQVDECTGASIAYVCGYVNKQKFFRNHGDQDDRVAEFSFMSKGLGKEYLTKQKKKHLKNKQEPYLVDEDGMKLPMPRYYKEKTFNEQEKANLALKAKDYIENNPNFVSEKDKIDFITIQAEQRRREASTKRRKI